MKSEGVGNGMDEVAIALRKVAPITSWKSSGTSFAPETLSKEILGLLPAGYLEFLEVLGAGEGFLGTSFLRVYPLDEAAAANREYHVDEFLPRCLLFGSDGCGNAYLFDLEKRPSEIIRVPFIPLDREFGRSMGNDFLRFVESLAEIPRGYTGPLPVRPNPETAGKEIHEKHPVVLGGDPTSPDNKVFLAPPEHAKASTFFNRLVRKVRAEQAP